MDNNNIPSVTIPPSTAHTHTVVFLHGRGDNVQSFASSLEYSRDSSGRTLREVFPSFKWIFPQAPVRPCAAFPGDRMPQWFDIWNTANFSEKEDLQATGLKESVTGVRRILANEAAALGGRWDRIILAGISQGAATNVHTLLNLHITGLQNQPRRLGAFLGFSCRMPFPGRTLADARRILSLDGVPADNEVIRNTPVLLEHCVDDPLVLVGNGRTLRDTLRGFGSQVEWIEYPDGGHWFNSPAGIDDVTKFLSKHLVGTMDNKGGPATQGTQGRRDPDEMDLS